MSPPTGGPANGPRVPGSHRSLDRVVVSSGHEHLLDARVPDVVVVVDDILAREPEFGRVSIRRTCVAEVPIASALLGVRPHGDRRRRLDSIQLGSALQRDCDVRILRGRRELIGTCYVYYRVIG